MKRKISFLTFLMLAFLFLNHSDVFAALSMPTGTNLPQNEGGIAEILANFLYWVLEIIGLIAMISFVISGIQYFFAAGDEKMMETAKRNFTYSIIGVVAALSGFVIIRAIDVILKGGDISF